MVVHALQPNGPPAAFCHRHSVTATHPASGSPGRTEADAGWSTSDAACDGARYGRVVAPNPRAPDRNLAMELVRVTEAAAMAAGRWMGRGDKEGADGAAVQAMRVVLQTVSMDGVVVIGEGEKDNAPMLYNGEHIGDGSPPPTDIAVDPIDGTTPTSLGRGGALAVIAVSERGTMFNPGPCVYMEKLAVGPEGGRVRSTSAAPRPRTSRRWPRRWASRSATSPWSSSTGPATPSSSTRCAPAAPASS